MHNNVQVIFSFCYPRTVHITVQVIYTLCYMCNVHVNYQVISTLFCPIDPGSTVQEDFV